MACMARSVCRPPTWSCRSPISDFCRSLNRRWACGNRLRIFPSAAYSCPGCCQHLPHPDLRTFQHWSCGVLALVESTQACACCAPPGTTWRPRTSVPTSECCEPQTHHGGRTGHRSAIAQSAAAEGTETRSRQQCAAQSEPGRMEREGGQAGGGAGVPAGSSPWRTWARRRRRCCAGATELTLLHGLPRYPVPLPPVQRRRTCGQTE